MVVLLLPLSSARDDGEFDHGGGGLAAAAAAAAAAVDDVTKIRYFGTYIRYLPTQGVPVLSYIATCH